MKRKRLIVGGIVAGVLVVLCLLVAVGGPLAVRLGMRPVCIQGSFPRMRIVSCPGPTAAAVTPWPLPTRSGEAPIPIIVDDDGSPDGMMALLYLLRNPLYEVKAVTISQGEAHPEVFARHVARMLAELGRADIPVGAGRATPLAGTNAFPDSFRQASDAFWNIALRESAQATQPVPAAELIASTLRGSNEPVALLVTGSHTNLAEALRLDPGLAARIRDVTVMGGSIYQPGNVGTEQPQIDNSVAEWNIWVDPVAAGEVVAAGLPLHLVPLDGAGQVEWSDADAARWAASDAAEARLAARLLRQLLSWSPDNTMYAWDLVAAAVAVDRRLCPEERLALDVVTADGPQQGQTAVAGGAPNAGVCLAPDVAQLKAQVDAIFSH
jgi:purine nucleosidase/pyrimidine-specific ribonucleoside hydrolase